MALIAELQAEISQLKEKIIEKNQRGSSEHFLREEIERLNFQLTESVQTNDNLSRELRTVTDSLRREKLSVEELIQDWKRRESEKNILALRKEELERQNTILKLEKESLSNSLENAVCKISSMERRQQDQETEMRLSEREVFFVVPGEGTRGEREAGTLCFVFMTPGYSSVLAPLLPTGPKIFKFSFATCIFRFFEGQY